MRITLTKKLTTFAVSAVMALGVVGLGATQAHAVYKYGYMCSYDVDNYGARAAQTKSNSCAEAQPRVYFRTASGARDSVDGPLGSGTRRSPDAPTGMSVDGFAGRAFNLGVMSAWQEK